MADEATVQPDAADDDGHPIYSVTLRSTRLGEYLWVSIGLAVVAVFGAALIDPSPGPGIVAGLAASLLSYLVWPRIRPSHPPFGRPAELVLTTKWLIAYRANGGPEVDRRPLVDLDGSRFRAGLGPWVPARLTVTFSDGEEWTGTVATGRGPVITMHEYLVDLLTPEPAQAQGETDQ